MLGPHKGLSEALAWARENESVEFYGDGPLSEMIEPPGVYMGPVPPEEVPEVMASYERFLFLPASPDPCPRTVLEADAAGCEVITNPNAGSMWWLRSRPKEVSSGVERFWEAVCGLM
jgi:hypothetical protein